MNQLPIANPNRERLTQALRSSLSLLERQEPNWESIQSLLTTAQRELVLAEHWAPSVLPETPSSEVEEFVQAAPAEASQTISANHPPRPVNPPAAGPTLAEKLSDQPVPSIPSSLSINNRVRYATLLTNGNVPEFMGLCEALDSCASFDDAQQLLRTHGSEIDWEDEEGGGTDFINLVRRRFLTA